MKFATKLLLGLSGTILIGATSMLAVGGGQTAKLFEKQIIMRMEDNAYHMIEKLDRDFAERFLHLRAFVQTPAFIAAASSPEQTTRHLEEYLRWHPEYPSGAFFTADRVAVADTAGPGGGEQEDPGGCWAEIAAGKDTAVCVQRASPGGSPMIRLAVVVKDGRATRGVAVLRLPLQVLEEHLRQDPRSRGYAEHLHVDLLDREGVLLYSNFEREGILQQTSPDWAFLRERVSAGQVSGSLRYTNPAETTGEEILVYVREQGFGEFAGSGWTLVLFVPTSEVFAPVGEFRLKIAIVVLGAASTLLTIMFLLVRAFTRPIEELGRAAREIERGNLHVRVPAGARDELGLFAGTFNQMAASLQESQRALATSNRELEDKIEERTLELLRTNEALHAELSERVKAQEALVVRERLLRLNADVGEAVIREANVGATLQLCGDVIARDLDAVLVRIWTMGDEEGVLELRASAGEFQRIDGQHSRKIVGELKIGIIAKEQRPILTNAVAGDADITDQEWVRREGIVAFAGYPLIVDRKTAGVLALFARRPLERHVLASLAVAADKIALYLGRKGAENALRESEQRYRDLFASSSDGVYTVNAAGVFTSMNQAGALIFGHESPDEIVGRPVLDYWRDPRSRAVFLEELETKKALSAYPIAARKKNGELLELESSARRVEDAAGNFLGVQGVLRDVTERMRAAAERELLLAQLQEAAASVKTLSGLLPICAGCKKIRDREGSWSQIETYIKSHSEAEFTHGLCPDCLKVYFPGTGGKS